MSENEIEMNVEQTPFALGPEDPEEIVEYPVVKSRGRKPKYLTEEERREAKRLQNKRYRTKKHEELVALRRVVNQLTTEKSQTELTDSQTE